MKRQFSALVSVGVVSAIALLASPPVSRGQTPPPVGGGYTDVIANPPAIEVIGGALFKPAGTGPFPAVISMSGCGGIDSPPNRAQQTATIDHLRSKGVAILIVDSFTPRNEPKGVCANL